MLYGKWVAVSQAYHMQIQEVSSFLILSNIGIKRHLLTILYLFFSEMLRSKIIQTGAKFLVVDESKAEAVNRQIQDMGCKVIVIGQMDGCIPFDRLIEQDVNSRENNKFDEAIIDLDSPVWMPFSSGTTGEPKGILHTHRSMSHLFILRQVTRFGLSNLNF